MKKFFAAALIGPGIFSVNFSADAETFNNEIKFQKLYTKPVVNVQGGQAVVVNCEEWITLRGEPSIYGEDLAHIPPGAYVVRYQDVPGTDFCIVRYEEILGYVLKQYIRSTGVEY